MSIVFSDSGAFFQSIYVLSLRHAYSLLAPSWLLRSGVLGIHPWRIAY